MADVLYVSSTCSQTKYTQYVENKNARISQQAQKYNLLLAEGLAKNGANVKVLSTRPINRSIEKRLWMKKEQGWENGVHFCYLAFVNYPVLRAFYLMFGVFFHVLFSSCKKRDTVVICDALNISASVGALAAAFLRGFPTMGIVTDVPCHLATKQEASRSQKMNLAIMRRFGSYLLLTEQMNEVVNVKKRPYIVLEGHADQTMALTENVFEHKQKEKVCLYAGSIMEIYGIGELVKGFLAADIPNSQLHIYGDGDYADRLKKLAMENDNIHYFGVAPNHEVVKAELAATLLVNPRPTHEEYTKYSFPSKNMEYMASGTPVLTTRLPGMPEDHEAYVYFIEEENADGMKEALQWVLSQDPRVIHDYGIRAKNFVMREKNNVTQASKVIGFVKSTFGIE